LHERHCAFFPRASSSGERGGKIIANVLCHLNEREQDSTNIGFVFPPNRQKRGRGKKANVQHYGRLCESIYLPRFLIHLYKTTSVIVYRDERGVLKMLGNKRHTMLRLYR
jgi:hypothetical protein